MACHLPWVGVADEDFPGHAPDGAPPCLLFLSLVCLVGAVRLPSLVLVRVIQEGPAPLDDRDVPLGFTTFQVMGPVQVQFLKCPGSCQQRQSRKMSL